VNNKIYVTRAQGAAARMIVDRSARSGRPVRWAVSRIAEASRRALSGRSAGPAPRRTPVTES